MKNYIIFSSILLVMGTMSFGLGSCNKKADTIVKIKVRDTASALVVGARVVLYGESTEVPKKPVVRRDTAFTNAAGIAIFNFNEVYQTGQAGVAVLNISARKDGLNGEGIIKVEQEIESITTVFIQP